jgi:hypothetical protein
MQACLPGIQATQSIASSYVSWRCPQAIQKDQTTAQKTRHKPAAESAIKKYRTKLERVNSPVLEIHTNSSFKLFIFAIAYPANL